ncbi:Methyltransferase family protein [Frankia canadensis]|uniref:Methyltransferase family protein n=1 Tax=Frankia canadensis TaxID=1836972 RepID=A0A2I2KT25_9ACTN|nr:class I SAM-dependent methyltransferase [Frankia canadensis]SNQ48810.1 Methyltransferase family protein [Frankia canadensis]SOU56100.1 Methyltransferase family protein [Frankia canadensis]
MAEGATAAHYERLAGTYDLNWTYSDAFVEWMAGEIVDSLSLTADDRIADVGCGTGLYTRRVLRLVRPRTPVLCVDPSAAMLKQLSADSGLRPIRASAEEIAGVGGTTVPPVIPPGSLDALVIKEAIHHVALADRPRTIAGLARTLDSFGRLLIVMLPTRIEYPLFAAAMARFEELQPDPADIADQMRAAGLSVQVTYREFALRIPKSRYLEMVGSRYMSLLSMFDDAEIAAGVAEIDAAHAESVLSFHDRFAFVLGGRGRSTS